MLRNRMRPPPRLMTATTLGGVKINFDYWMMFLVQLYTVNVLAGICIFFVGLMLRNRLAGLKLGTGTQCGNVKITKFKFAAVSLKEEITKRSLLFHKGNREKRPKQELVVINNLATVACFLVFATPYSFDILL